MKADKKTILILVLMVLDCVFGGIIVYDYIFNHESEKSVPLRASGNYVVVEDVFDSVVVQPKQEVKEEKVEAKEQIVYDGLTLNQLSDKLNRSLKSDLTGKGQLVASYSLAKGVDPYVATAIMLHETGCEWGCSRLVKECNNVGGQKGSGCGSYSYFSSLDTGIKKFIDNLAKNYYAKGLNTPEKMNKKYATSKTWSTKVNKYVTKIKSN